MRKYCPDCNQNSGKTFPSYSDYEQHFKNLSTYEDSYHSQIDMFEVKLEGTTVDVRELENWNSHEIKQDSWTGSLPQCSVTGNKIEVGKKIYLKNVTAEREDGSEVKLGTVAICEKVKDQIDRNQSNKKLSSYS